jgi:hypothetical protein
MAASDTNGNGDDKAGDSQLDHIASALKGLRFGQVTITIQDGVVVQIDRTERRRLGRAAT